MPSAERPPIHSELFVSRECKSSDFGLACRPAARGACTSPFCFYTRARMQNNYNCPRDKSPLLGNQAHVIANDSRILYLIRFAVSKKNMLNWVRINLEVCWFFYWESGLVLDGSGSGLADVGENANGGHSQTATLANPFTLITLRWG